MKRFFSILLVMVILLTLFTFAPLSAEAKTSGEYDYELLDDNSAVITGYNGDNEDLVIPSIIDGHTVTQIGPDAFSCYYSLVTIDIPKSVEYIGMDAFYDCEWLETVYYGGTVDEWIELCKNYEDSGPFNPLLGAYIYCSDGEYYYYEGEEPYEDNPEDPFSEGYIDFDEYKNGPYTSGNYTYVELDDGTVRIVGCASASVAELVIPETINGKTVSSITGHGSPAGDYSNIMMDWNNETVKKIVLPKTLKTIGDCAFINFKALKEITIPDGVTYLSDGLFVGCSALESISFPDSVTHMGNAFSSCFSLKEIKLSENTDQIAWQCFYNCTSLTEITLPASVKKIEMYAFLNCPALRSCTVLNPQTTFHPQCGLGSIFNGLEWKKSEDFTMIGYSESTAKEYADQRVLDFIALDRQSIICGDADGDSNVTIVDATRIQRYIAELCNIDGSDYTAAEISPAVLKACDADLDNDLTIMDATAIQRYIAELPTNDAIGRAV